jgi:hypothetical protein
MRRTVGLFLLIASLHLFVNGARLSQSELWLDEASTYWLAASPLSQLPARTVEFHSQPPLYYLLLHGVIRIDDAEWAVRGLSWLFSLLFVAWVMFAAKRLSLGTRTILSVSFILLEFGSMYARETRPYTLAALTSFAATLAFADAFDEPRRLRSCLAYGFWAIVTLYSLAFDVVVVLVHGLFFLVTFTRTVRRDGVAAAFERYKALVLVFCGVALLYLPYLILVVRWQGSIGHPSLLGSLREALNPRHQAQAIYRFAGGAIVAVLAVVSLAVAVLRREKLIWLTIWLFVGQVAFAHGFMHGRYGFNLRYLMPAFPIFCLWLGLGADRLLSKAGRVAWPLVVVALLVTDAFAARSFVGGLREPTLQRNWRGLYAEVERLPGKKAVFFDVGWVGQPFAYVARRDPRVVQLLEPGRGWLSGGSPLDRAYLDDNLARMKSDADCFVYVVTSERAEADGPYQSSFVPWMSKLGHREVFDLLHLGEGFDAWEAHAFCKAGS